MKGVSPSVAETTRGATVAAAAGRTDVSPGATSDDPVKAKASVSATNARVRRVLMQETLPRRRKNSANPVHVRNKSLVFTYPYAKDCGSP